MKKFMFLVTLTAVMFATANAATGPLYIYEILFDPDGIDTPNEYVEIIGQPGTTIPANTYFIGIEGDSNTTLGQVQDFTDISGMTFGSGGFLVLVQPGNFYTIQPGANFSATLNEIENASATFILAQSAMPPIIGTDIDIDDNGEPDGAFYSQLVINDSIGLLDGGISDRAYGEFNYLENGFGSFPAGTNFHIDTFDPGYAGRRGFTSGSMAADWVVTDDPTVFPPMLTGIGKWDTSNLGGAAPWYLPAAANAFPDSVAGVPLNHIGAPNVNFAPTAAGGMISGRALTANGSGIKFVSIMLSGGALTEPIYATTNHFGHYRFEELAAGQSYVLQVISRRHAFRDSSIVVNLDGNIVGADFVEIDPGGDTKGGNPSKKRP